MTEGTTLELKCKLSGESSAVKWTKDDNAITDGGKYEVLRNSLEQKLLVRDFQASDEGLYTFNIGRRKTSCKAFRPGIHIVCFLNNDLQCNSKREFY